MVKIDQYEFPDDLYYSDHYLWAKVDGNILIVGATHYAAIESGDISRLDLIVRKSDKVFAGDPFGSVESSKGATTLYAPVSGTISEINEKVEMSPNLINKDCYRTGWIVKIDASNLHTDLKKLFRTNSTEFIEWQNFSILAKKRNLI